MREHLVPEWAAVICLGIIEGVTEFLPVSSTGHLLLAEHWLPEQSDVFNTVIQCGAVLAVLVIFTSRVKQMLFHWRDAETRDYILKLATAFFITGVGGLVLKKFDFELPESALPVAWATLIGGVLFLICERWLQGRPLSHEITWRIAIVVGIAQLIAAIFPGTSRSGVTILAALVLGLNRPAAAEFSFLLGIPTLLSAGALQIVSAIRNPPEPPIDWGLLGLGTLIAAVTAFITVKWLLRYIQTHTFVGFGWYRIVLGVLMLLFAR
ncbi:MAG: undecaprenyl-diphosphate phosphatase [Verrucomicrobiota bacterium]